MRLIKIDNIVNTDTDSSILYQRHYSADAIFELNDQDKETLKLSIIFMIEMNPIHFKYYIRNIIPDSYSNLEVKNILIKEIEKLHDTGIIDFVHIF